MMVDLDFRHPLTETDTLIFLHIPKTGGVTLDEILARQFAWDDIYPAPTPMRVVTTPEEGSFPAQHVDDLFQAHRNFNPINPKTGKKYRLLIGHWDFSLVDKFPDMLPVTFLRDPVKRLISHYHQVKRQNDKWNTRYHEFQSMSLLDWAKDAEIQRNFGNVQTRYMAGCMWDDKLLFGRELINRAMENLRKCAFVGMQERFDDSLLLLSYTFGWKPIVQYNSHNITPTAFASTPVTPDEYNALSSLCNLDQELYEYGKRIYNARLAGMISQLFEATPEITGIPPIDAPHHQKSLVKRIFNADLRQQIEKRIADSALAFESSAEPKHSEVHIQASEVFDEQAFAQKLQEFEAVYNREEFEKLVERNRFIPAPASTPSYQTVMQDYPYYTRLLVDHPKLAPTIERYLPALQPFVQGPFPLPGQQVIHGPWSGSYKTQNFPRCDVTQETVRDKRVLDVGCNAGFDCFYYAALGAAEVIGIDHGPFIYQALFLRALYHCPGLQFIQTRWQNLPPIGTFDIVNCQGVLYHEPNPISLIRALFDLLRPGGKLVLETHVTLKDDMNTLFVEDKFRGDSTYWWVPSVPVTEAMLRSCGFVDVQVRSRSRAGSANPQDPDYTVEGIPAGGRAFLTAVRPLKNAAFKP
jgi:SAM-dependent methyltransferase